MIRAIVFDIGRVLIQLQVRRLFEVFTPPGAELVTVEQFVATTPVNEHESGRLPGAAFIEAMVRAAHRPVTVEQMHATWLDIFEPQPQMIGMANRLSEGYRVYLLSNVGEIHWAHLRRAYQVHRIGHGALPSFEAGVMKPHEAIYAECERRFGLEPASTAFIDDRPENIDAAHARGWRGIVHGSYEQTLAALRALDVRI